MTSPKHISGIEMQQDGVSMVPNGPDMGPNGPDMGPNRPDMGPNRPCMGPNGLEKDEKHYADFIFPENIPEHEWNRNGA